jgi:predicted Zn-dependent protease
VDAHLLLARALAGAGRLSDAEQRLIDTMKIAPDNSHVIMALGQVQAREGRRQAAETSLKKAVALSPESPEAHVGLAEFLIDNGRPSDGEQELRSALNADPDDLDANRAYATYLSSGKQCVAAEPYWKKVAAKSTDDSGSLALADYYVWSGRADEALKVLTPLAKTRDEGGRARTRIAAILYDRGDRTGAQRTLDQVLAKDATSPAALKLKELMK